ncbi:hypothetical protein B0H14DRAFT_474920 [Mycena olivaceomarginata]|nr:hypothetical protein B0H14DRAFT_474920 [Mycena olivaceomarginata]
MITDVNLITTISRSMMSRPLKRGRACMNCRFLKIKCDGIKPICGPCQKHPKDDECEYSDGPARSRTKALEDTVQRLEARLHELEHSEDTVKHPGRSLSSSSPESQCLAPLSPSSTPPYDPHWSPPTPDWSLSSSPPESSPGSGSGASDLELLSVPAAYRGASQSSLDRLSEAGGEKSVDSFLSYYPQE